MRILHISDTHLGRRPYYLDYREEDIYDTFRQLVDKALEERVDVVIHSGDMFDTSRPSPRAIIKAMEQTKRLRDAGIRLLSIAGNHDKPKVRGEMNPLRILEGADLLTILKRDRPFMVSKGEKEYHFYGVEYNPSRDTLLEYLKAIRPSRNSILLLHQGFKENLGFNDAWELTFQDLPTGFSYIACGHVHDRMIRRLSSGTLLGVAGSPEIMDRKEIRSFHERGKGGFLVDLSKEEGEISPVQVDIREHVEERVDSSEVDRFVMDFLEKYKGAVKKPILHITLQGKSMGNREAVTRLKPLHDAGIYYDLDNQTSTNLKDIKHQEDAVDQSPERLIMDYLQGQGYDERESRLILNLVEELEASGGEKDQEVIDSLKKTIREILGMKLMETPDLSRRQ